MAWTQATPNGGNSQKTGNRNKNNNASANAQTANYGSGNQTYASPNEQGQNKPAPAPTPTPVYASPNEQGQNKPAPTPVYPSPNEQGQNNPPPSNNGGSGGNNSPATTTPAPPAAITDDSLNAWLDSLEKGFNLRDGLTKRSIEDNTNLIKDNIKNINTNQQSTDDMFIDNEEDLSKLFFEQRTQGDQILNTNKDVDDVATNLSETDSTVGAVQSKLSDQQQELLQLDASAKKLGLSLVDTQGVQVDIKRDIIENQDRMQQGQNSDFIARTALDNQVNKAVDSVGVRLDDANENFDSFTDYTEDSFDLVVGGQQILGDELEESGFKMDNIFSTVESQAKRRQKELQAEDKELRQSVELNAKEDSYNQEYWAARLKQLQDDPETADQAQTILSGEKDVLKDKAYSGDKIITVDDQNLQRENLMAINSQLGVLGASPAAPPEYIFEQTLNNIDGWIEDGNGSVKETVSGMFDENTERVYTLDSGDVITRRMTSPVINDEDGNEMVRLGDDTDQLFVNGVELGTRKGDITTTTKDGEANHVDSTTGIGDDNNPNSPANRPDGGNQNNNGGQGQGQGQGNQSEAPVAPTDPVVGEDIPLPDDLTDPNGTGAYGQDGNAFTLDGVTFWKRIKDRNGRWTYTRMDSFENQGTTARRQDWGQNVQNF